MYPPLRYEYKMDHETSFSVKPKIYHYLFSDLATYKQGTFAPYQIMSPLKHKISSHTFQIKNKVVN